MNEHLNKIFNGLINGNPKTAPIANLKTDLITIC